MPNESSLLCGGTNNSVALIVGSTGGVLLADRMMWVQYAADADNAVDESRTATVRASLRRMSRTLLIPDNALSAGTKVLPDGAEVAAEESNEAVDEVVDNNDKQGSLSHTLAGLGNALVVSLIGVGYPVAVLPYYRAESTTEYVRRFGMHRSYA